MIWYGAQYVFAVGQQAAVVEALWVQWERSGRRDGSGLSETTLQEKVGSTNDNFRLAHVFRGHAAFGTMIRSVTKGVFALYAPESQENHTS